MRQQFPFPTPKVCQECESWFDSPSELYQHLKSVEEFLLRARQAREEIASARRLAEFGRGFSLLCRQEDERKQWRKLMNELLDNQPEPKAVNFFASMHSY